MIIPSLHFSMDTRYLLILTENLSVLSVILDAFANKKTQPPEVVFGSRFSDDVSYTQVTTHLCSQCL